MTSDGQPQTAHKPPALLYGVLIFLSAWLVFQVQPLIGKFILPWFGSAAALWAAILVFFQLLLLAGYAYAHLLSRHFHQRMQVRIHLACLLVALAFLPIIPAAHWQQAQGEDPTAVIMMLLLVTVGGPYFVLSATSPLFQRWFADQYADTSPYRLYAVSNAGSLLGLFTYPFLVEPLMTRHTQAWVWSAGFAVFAAMAAVLVWRTAIQKTMGTPPTHATITSTTRLGRKVLWVALAALPSALLVASPARIAMSLPPLPMLFVAVLGLYLLTFIIAFDSPRWYRRRVFVPLLALVALFPPGAEWGPDLKGIQELAQYLLLMFAVAMCCHGELSRLKPPAQELTGFYLLVSFGGAIGGVLAAIVAPQVFIDLYEYDLAVAGSLAITLWLVVREHALAQRLPLLALGVPALASLTLAWVFSQGIMASKPGNLEQRRSFYGVLTVREWMPEGAPAWHALYLAQGSTLHGMQYTNPRKINWTNSYYGASSGVGRAVLSHPTHGKANRQFRLGVVGLGVGLVSVYANDSPKRRNLEQDPNDVVVFYEIDPNVQDIAEHGFTYLAQARARGVDVSIEIGDARTRMQEQLSAGQPGEFDILVIDAFASDAVPTHLLTREAVAIYLQHLREGGALAFNISSQHLDLRYVLYAQATEAGLHYRRVSDPGDHFGHSSSTWVVITKNPLVYDNKKMNINGIATAEEKTILWTDEYSSLLDVIRY